MTRQRQVGRSDSDLGQERQSRRWSWLEAALSDIVNATSDCVLITDPQQHILFLNTAGRNLLGLDESEQVDNFAGFYTEGTNRLMESQAFPAASREGSWEGNGMLLARGAREIPVSIVVTGHKSEQVEFFSITMRDVSHFMQVQVALQESEERFRLMSDTAPVMIWMSGMDKLCTHFNKPWLDFTGRALTQELGNGWAEGVHPDDYNRCLAIYVESFDARRPFRMEYRLRRFDGQFRWILDTGTPRFQPDGAFAGYIGSCIDIQDRKDIEASLEKRVEERTAQLSTLNRELSVARDRALEASGLKSSFVANISHELRTPLSGILGMNELLLATGLNQHQKEMAQVVQESARSLLAIVNDILDLSKIEAGRLTIESVPFDLAALVHDCAQSFFPAANSKMLSLSFDMDPRIPRTIYGDPIRLRQVLLNLLGNAIKFTEQGGISVKGCVESENSKLVTIKFSVIDTGVGIAEDDQKYLFTPFMQADSSTTRKHSGTGLGLAISKRLVELMGGTIGLTSTKGHGSVFWFTVPYAFAGIAAQCAGQPDSENERGGRAANLVLIVEDNRTLQQVMSKQLEALHIQARIASNASEALQECGRLKFAAILMDCQLPDIDGPQAVRMIRELEGESEHVPIIAVTAGAMSGDRERCLRAGMDDYLSKPYKLEDLRDVLNKWMPGARTD